MNATSNVASSNGSAPVVDLVPRRGVELARRCDCLGRDVDAYEGAKVRRDVALHETHPAPDVQRVEPSGIAEVVAHERQERSGLRTDEEVVVAPGEPNRTLHATRVRVTGALRVALFLRTRLHRVRVPYLAAR